MAKLLERLSTEIEDWILDGDIPAGQRLPPEDQLAEQFSVSRTVVREGLARLRERGLVETVNGSGTFVREPSSDFLADVLRIHLRVTSHVGETMHQLFEARAALEGSAARLAAERATLAQVSEMEACVQRMRDAKRPSGFTAGDVAFHTAIASASHNQFLETLVTPLVEVMVKGIAFSTRTHRTDDDVLDGHHAIVRSIRQRDPSGAESAMVAHLAASKLNFQAGLK